MTKKGLRNFFRCGNLIKIITAHLLFQARLNPREDNCLMTNPFPKGPVRVELSPNFHFLVHIKAIVTYNMLSL